MASLIAVLLDVPNIIVVFGLSYVLAAWTGRAWWHIPVVSAVASASHFAIFRSNRYSFTTGDEVVAQVVVTLFVALLAYLSMGLPKLRRRSFVEAKLVELRALHDKGLVSDHDYDAARKRILDSL